MKALKQDARYAWYPEVNLYALSSGMRAADSAWRNRLDSLAGRRAERRRVGYPRFAKKGRRESFTLYHDKRRPTLRPDGYRRLNLPTKAGGSIRLHGNIRALAREIRHGEAVISSVTISKGGTRWWASILVEETAPAPTPTLVGLSVTEAP